MRYVLSGLLTVFLVGCSNNTTLNPEPLWVSTVSEQKTFIITDDKNRLKRISILVERYIEKFNITQDKAVFYINYPHQVESFVHPLKNKLKIKNISPDRLNFTRNSQPIEEQVSVTVIAKYTKINNRECGTLSMNSSKSYHFGCITEYNHKITQSQPLKGDE